MFTEVLQRSRVKYRQRSCLMKCNREVTWISRQSKGGKFLKKLWCCVGGSIKR